jgi:hypothetical protein
MFFFMGYFLFPNAKESRLFFLSKACTHAMARTHQKIISMYHHEKIKIEMRRLRFMRKRIGKTDMQSN